MHIYLPELANPARDPACAFANVDLLAGGAEASNGGGWWRPHAPPWGRH
jgi:hypothetical protein